MYERIGGFTVTRGHLPGGEQGTRVTLALMKRMAVEGSRDVEVRDAAIQAVRSAGVRSHDYLGQLAALFRFVRDQVAFVRDIHGVEVLQSPRYTLEKRGGDCDDRATLLVALARSIGIPADLRFRVIAADPRNRQRFSHVYVVAQIGARVIPMDPTYSSTDLGWQYPSPFRVGDFRI